MSIDYFVGFIVGFAVTGLLFLLKNKSDVDKTIHSLKDDISFLNAKLDKILNPSAL